jgi:hypothetical protein
MIRAWGAKDNQESRWCVGCRPAWGRKYFSYVLQVPVILVHHLGHRITDRPDFCRATGFKFCE